MDVTIGDFEIAKRAAEAIEITAIVVIVATAAFAVVATLVQNIRARERRLYAAFARRMSNGLLIGLDLLIAADVIESVTVNATLESITGLALLVLIRTFLSWTLIVELENRWPWQADPAETADE